MSRAHRHDMRPDRPVKPTVFRCSLCAFRCTPASVATVRRNAGQHRVVKAGTPEAAKVWGS